MDRLFCHYDGVTSRSMSPAVYAEGGYLLRLLTMIRLRLLTLMTRTSYLSFIMVVFSVIALGVCQPCLAGPIYVFREKDGSIRFTDRKPPEGVQAKVFTASKPNFSTYRVGPPILMTKWVFKRARHYRSFIERLSEQFGVDSSLVKAVVHAESAFNPHAVSPKGAQGLMQLMPSTARMVGVNNPFMVEDNLRGGVRYLSKLIRKYSNVRHALAAYNAGEGAVDQYGGIPPYSETQTYVSRVLALREKYKQGADQG
jgi:Transglycosylase SLT domain